MSFQKIIFTLMTLTAISCGNGRPSEGTHKLNVLVTNDMHGSWFDSSYTGKSLRKSLMSAKRTVDSIRIKEGADNVLLLDAGDFLQGDNAAYYFNYVDTAGRHLFVRLAEYMKYDAVVAGNHDIETGHAVYDKVGGQLEEAGIAFLGGNAFKDNGERYFPYYKIFRRAGLKVAVLGYSNPNMAAWLDESLWSGMSFRSLIPLVQEDVYKVREKEKPDVVIVAAHSGTGDGKGESLESQGLELFNTLEGVDLLFTSHDHRPLVRNDSSMALLNSGSHCRYLSYGKVKVEIKGGKAVSRKVEAKLLPLSARNADTVMRKKFEPDFQAVKAFTLKEIGVLDESILTRDAFKGWNTYVSLLHKVALDLPEVDVSFAAPLSYNETIAEGKLIYDDLFKLYPFENQLFTMKLTGRQIKDYLELSYDRWLAPANSGHFLNIESKGSGDWVFKERSYNFDSAGGLRYEVDTDKGKGERVRIISFAGGKAFSEDSTYVVAMTSYRANGGGDLLLEGAGVVPAEAEIAGRHPEIRIMLYDYIKERGGLRAKEFADTSTVGYWEFAPESKRKMLEKDFSLLFP